MIRSISEGDVFQFKLDEHLNGAVIVAGDKDCAFLNSAKRGDFNLDEIPGSIVAFRIYVDPYSIKRSSWKKIGKIRLPSSLAAPAQYLNQPVGTNDVFIYLRGEFIPSTYSEAKGLEVLSVWDADSAVKRLRDHLEGRTNLEVELHKPMEELRFTATPPENGNENSK